MKKSVWLFILLLMILNFFYILPIGMLILIGRGIIFLIMGLLWLFIGVTYYKTDIHNPLQKAPKYNVPS